MAESEDLQLEIDNKLESDKPTQVYSFRDGIIFLIDATEPMFKVDPDTQTTYFSQCLETYKNILTEKLSWNLTDWMGIILMGTNKWDKDPEIKHVYTWQRFKVVSIEQLIEIEKALENPDKFHDEIGSSTIYPLYDALLHASRCFNDVKIKMPYRKIVLLTREDNPFVNDRKEQYRIKEKAHDCYNMKIQLSVVGFGKKWNPDNFFGEFESYSGKFGEAEKYRRTSLTDLEEQVKHASRITKKLEWTLGNGVKLGVSISTIVAKTKFPKRIQLKKDNNEPLDAYSYYRKAETGDSEDEVDGDEDQDEDEGEDEDEKLKRNEEKIVLSKNVYKCHEYGGRNIKFTVQETRRLINSRKPGITLMGFKPQNILDVSFHLEAPKFVSYDESEFIGSKHLFSALLSKCEEKQVMAICVVTFREQSGSYLHAMIPNSASDGFYAYKLPFAENVRDLTPFIFEYCYDETENVCPINEDTLDLCYKFIKKSTFAYNPTMFPNPKLYAEFAVIEALAMDRDSSKESIDSTIPDKKILHERLGDLKDRLENMFLVHRTEKCVKRSGEPSLKVSNKVHKVEEIPDFNDLVQNECVEKCTVKQLKDYLKSVGISPVGRKAELVDMVYKYKTA